MNLVTGGTGLIGSHLLWSLAQQDIPVRALHRPGSSPGQVLIFFRMYAGYYGKENAFAEQLFDRIQWQEGDITDYDSLVRGLQDVTKVYHAAAAVSFDPGDRHTMIRNNVEGTAQVINACLDTGIKKLCYISSTAALGSVSGGATSRDSGSPGLVTEDLPWYSSKRVSAYSLSKHKSEMEVWRGVAEGLEVVIVNPGIVVGPGNWTRSSPRLFSTVWKGLKFYTEGVTGYVDVRDVVQAMISLMESANSGERYTLVTDNLSYREILTMIAEALGKKPPVIHAGPLLTAIAWRADWLKSKLTRSQHTITREAVRAGRRQTLFSNTKIREATGMDFIGVRQSVEETAKVFMESIS